MARSVADVALLLSAMAGPDDRSPIALRDPGAPFSAPLGRDFNGVRIAWWTDLGGLPVDPRVRHAVNAQRRVFEALGCRVEDAEPDFTDFDEVFKTLRAMAFLTGVADRVGPHRHEVKDTILWEIDRGERLTPREIARAETKRSELYHRMRQFMNRFEFFVLPAVQIPPFDVTQPSTDEVFARRSSPAISVPVRVPPEEAIIVAASGQGAANTRRRERRLGDISESDVRAAEQSPPIWISHAAIASTILPATQSSERADDRRATCRPAEPAVEPRVGTQAHGCRGFV
jgi:Asp-tRNA(Asn)/Glu-tRNA(Gln) amidotransferase A subunit family amidase